MTEPEEEIILCGLTYNRVAHCVYDRNQHTRELISARKTSHKHNNKTLTFVTYGNFHKLRQRYIKDVPLVEFVCLVFTRMPSESYRRQLGSLLLCLCKAFFFFFFFFFYKSANVISLIILSLMRTLRRFVSLLWYLVSAN